MSADTITIPEDLMRQYREDCAADFLAEIEAAMERGELTDEEVKALADTAGLTRAAA